MQVVFFRQCLYSILWYVVLTSRIHSRYQSVKNTIHLIPRIVYCNAEGRTSMILRTQTLTSIGNGSKGVGIAECQNPAVVLEGSLLSFLPFLVVLCFSFLILFSHQFHTHPPSREFIYIFPKRMISWGYFLLKMQRIFLLRTKRNIF